MPKDVIYFPLPYVGAPFLMRQVPDAVVTAMLSEGVAALPTPSGSATPDPTPTPTPAPAFTQQPSISPSSGTAGTTTFTANDGAASNASSYTRRWLLSGTSIGTGTTVLPGSAGSLALEVTATGPGGSTTVTTGAVTVAAAPTPTPTPVYTTPTRYSFAATRFRHPVVARAANGANLSLIGQFIFGSPAYATTNPRFFLPSFYQATGGVAEAQVANTITIEGVSILVGGTWYQAPTGQFPITIPATDSPGVLLPAIAGVTIPANTVITGRVAYSVPSGGSVPATPRSAALGEAIQGGTATLAAKLTDGSTLSGLNGHSDAYQPLYMIAQGGDGRPAFAGFGDSIGYGANETNALNATSVAWTARGAAGYLDRGMDDASTSMRLAIANFCVPGSRPLDITARDSTRSKLKLDAIKAAFTATGDWPFDFIVSQHGTNSVSGGTPSATLIAGMQTYLAAIKSDSGKPVTQVELLAKAGTTDGYATLANMTVTGQDSYNNGVLGANYPRWSLNAAIGVNGVSDPGTTLRQSGHIEDSFAPWLFGSYDTGNNRDRPKLRAFNTTLAASAAQGAISFSMTDAPTLYDYLNIAYTGGYADGFVMNVTGSGPYTVTMAMTSQVGASGAPSGAVVRAQQHALDGTHPGSLAHKDDYAQAVVGWKQRRGWL